MSNNKNQTKINHDINRDNGKNIDEHAHGYDTKACQGHIHHHHGHQIKNGHNLSVKEKLSMLFDHWIEHNNSHKDNYVSWAEKAENENLPDTAVLLIQAAQASDIVTQKLEDALKTLK
jgi:hypothetical protein